MGKAIAIPSGKGGVGKSTAAASIGAGLAACGKRTLLIDMDIGLRSLDIMLGAQNDMVYDLVDLALGVCSAKQALFPIKGRERLWLLPASQREDSFAVTPSDMRALVQRLRPDFDFILLDCPAGVGRGFRNACAAADAAILVVTPDDISLRGAERTRELLQAEGVSDLQLLVNRVAKKNAVSTDECVRRMDIPVLGFIPEDPRVSDAAARGIPVLCTESDAGDAYERVVMRLLGKNIRYRIPHERLSHRFRTGFGREAACKRG